MPLSSEAIYGVRPLTQAINHLPINPTIIRELALFKPEYLTTTYVNVQSKEGVLTLVNAVPRGAMGLPVSKQKINTHTFETLHLPKHDIVRADDVQNIRAFGSDNASETIASKINDKLEAMKADIEYTREHLMLGALLGKLIDADGGEILDIYKRFGLTRKEFTWNLSANNANVGKEIDIVKTAQSKKRGGEALSGWIVLASEEFMQTLVYHKSVNELYLRYQDGEAYRNGETNVMFRHKNIDFIQYDHEFDSGVKIKENEAILLPKSTRNTFREFFAPADMNATVNSKALAYYASREKLQHDKGWDLHAQSNPLPLVLRPELMATLKLG